MRFSLPLFLSLTIAAAAAASVIPAKPKLNYAQIPLAFEADPFQSGSASSSRPEFIAQGQNYGLRLTGKEALLTVAPCPSSKHLSDSQADTLRMSISGANNAARPIPEQLLEQKVNYFIGTDPSLWRTGLSTYRTVRVPDVYRGIDLVYYGNQQQLEFDFVVAPHVDPRVIGLDFEEDRHLRILTDGSLSVSAQSGAMLFHKPVIYQEQNKQRHAIEGRFRLEADNVVHFDIGNYDRTKPLIIDPVLTFSTYVGGASQETLGGMTLDPSGNVYLTGTASGPYPTTPGAFNSTQSGNTVFVTKMNSTGTALIFSTFLGSGLIANSCGISVDTSGNVYVAGSTTAANWPVTSGVFQTTNKAQLQNYPINGFITKLNSTGAALIYSTYIGGSVSDTLQAFTVDKHGYAYLTGSATSPDFPVTSGAFQTTLHGTSSTFVTRLDPTGSTLVYSTFLNGSNRSEGTAIAVNSAAFAFVGGDTSSTDFPTTSAAYQTAPHSMFVTELNPTGNSLVVSTYFGGDQYPPLTASPDYLTTLILDKVGDIFIGGNSRSDNFPITPGAYQSTKLSPNTNSTAFLAELNPTASTLTYSTYLGGSNFDGISSLALDSTGDIFAAGSTTSSNFPVTPNALQPVLPSSGENYSGFVTELNLTSSTLVYSTYLGSSLSSGGIGSVALDNTGNVDFAGAFGPGFWVTPGAFQNSDQGTGNLVVGKINLSQTANVVIESNPSGMAFSISGNNCPAGTTVTPYVASWNGPCTVLFTDPVPISPGAEYVMTGWSDGSNLVSRTISPQSNANTNPYIAEFATWYELTTIVSPVAGGTTVPDQSFQPWYPAGTVVTVSEATNPGYIFTEYSGALHGDTPVQQLTMTGPETVTAHFELIPASSDTIQLRSKSGPSNARVWALYFANNGPGMSIRFQLAGMMFTQTAGQACTRLPDRVIPALPYQMGDFPVGATFWVPVTLDFSNCPSDAQFTVTIGTTANDGSSIAVSTLTNQSQ